MIFDTFVFNIVYFTLNFFRDQFDATFDLMSGDDDFVDFESFKRHIFGSAKLRECIYR